MNLSLSSVIPFGPPKLTVRILCQDTQVRPFAVDLLTQGSLRGTGRIRGTQELPAEVGPWHLPWEPSVGTVSTDGLKALKRFQDSCHHNNPINFGWDYEVCQIPELWGGRWTSWTAHKIPLFQQGKKPKLSAGHSTLPTQGWDRTNRTMKSLPFDTSYFQLTVVRRHLGCQERCWCEIILYMAIRSALHGLQQTSSNMSKCAS